MKKLVLVTAIVSATLLELNIAHANVGDAVQAIECEVYDGYIGLDSIKYIPIDEYSPIEKRNGRVYIAYSETECEDSTKLTFKAGEFKKLENGEKVYAQINHFSSSLKITGSVRCQKAKLRE